MRTVSLILVLCLFSVDAGKDKQKESDLAPPQPKDFKEPEVEGDNGNAIASNELEQASASSSSCCCGDNYYFNKCSMWSYAVITNWAGINVLMNSAYLGGWTVIQRRCSGHVDFYQRWNNYKWGFGDLRGNFWLGNEQISYLTNSGNYELRVDLVYNNVHRYARYSTFRVSAESDGYRLTVSGYFGTAGDSLAYHNGRKFSTYDDDNDSWGGNCAAAFRGAWWYGACHYSNLNGEWGAGAARGPRWYHFTGANPATYTEMAIRPRI